MYLQDGVQVWVMGSDAWQDVDLILEMEVKVIDTAEAEVWGQAEQITYWSVWCIGRIEGPRPFFSRLIITLLMMDHKGDKMMYFAL